MMNVGNNAATLWGVRKGIRVKGRWWAPFNRI